MTDRSDPDPGASVRIISERQLDDAILYEIEFLDPKRMTKPVSLGIVVGDNGVVAVPPGTLSADIKHAVTTYSLT